MRYWTFLASFISVAFIILSPRISTAETSGGYALYNEEDEDVYVAALKIPRKATGHADLESNEAKQLELKVLKNRISHRWLKRHFTHRISINNDQQVTESNSDALEYILMWINQPLKRGDHLVLRQDGSVFAFQINGKIVGKVKSNDIFDIILNAWVGEAPPTLQFKRQILGVQASRDPQEKYDTLVFNSERSNIAQDIRTKGRKLRTESEAYTGRTLNVLTVSP